MSPVPTTLRSVSQEVTCLLSSLGLSCSILQGFQQDQDDNAQDQDCQSHHDLLQCLTSCRLSPKQSFWLLLWLILWEALLTVVSVARLKAESASNAVTVSLNNRLASWFDCVGFSGVPSSTNTTFLTSCSLFSGLAFSFAFFALAIFPFLLLAFALEVRVGIVAITFPLLLAFGIAACVLSCTFSLLFILFAFHSVNIHGDHLIVLVMVFGDGQFLVNGHGSPMMPCFVHRPTSSLWPPCSWCPQSSAASCPSPS